jgi:hypothetical protein
VTAKEGGCGGTNWMSRSKHQLERLGIFDRTEGIRIKMF